MVKDDRFKRQRMLSVGEKIQLLTALLQTREFDKFVYHLVCWRFTSEKKKTEVVSKTAFCSWYVWQERRKVAPPGYPFASVFHLIQVPCGSHDQFHPFPGLLFGQFVSQDLKMYGQIWKADVTNNVGPFIFTALFLSWHQYMSQKFQRKITCEFLITERGRMSLPALLILYCVQHIVHLEAIV